MKHKNIITLLACILFSHLAGFIGSISTASSVSTWYTTLVKPAFQPPSWLFGPVWLALYTLIGIALYWIWMKNDRTALQWFIANWFFNMWWSILFFGLRSPVLALITIVILVGLICGMISASYRADRRTIWLLGPYLAWVTFAAVLNAAIVFLN